MSAVYLQCRTTDNAPLFFHLNALLKDPQTIDGYLRQACDLHKV